MNAYRKPGEPIEDGPSLLPKGPASTCPACGADRITLLRTSDNAAKAFVGYSDHSPLKEPCACTPKRRIEIGLWRKCKEPGNHLHEHCKVCHLQWLTAFKETP
jgi:hypothetical protein